MTDHTIVHKTHIVSGVYFLTRNDRPSICPFRPMLMEPTKFNTINWQPVQCNTDCPFHNTTKHPEGEDQILHTLECTGAPLAIKSTLQKTNSIKPV